MSTLRKKGQVALGNGVLTLSPVGTTESQKADTGRVSSPVSSTSQPLPAEKNAIIPGIQWMLVLDGALF